MKVECLVPQVSDDDGNLMFYLPFNIVIPQHTKYVNGYIVFVHSLFVHLFFPSHLWVPGSKFLHQSL